MSKIVVNSEDFLNFVSLCKPSLDTEKGLLFNVSSSQISVFSGTSDLMLALKGTVKGKFEDWGVLGIDNALLLESFLKTTTKDTIQLKKTENKLIAEVATLKFSSVLRAPQYVKNAFPEERYQKALKISTGNEFTLKSTVIKGLLKYINILKSPSLIFLSDGKTLSLKVDSQNHELSYDIVLEKEIAPFNVKFTSIIIELLELLKDYDLVFSLKNDAPLRIKLDTENLSFEYFVNPLIIKK